MGLLRGLLFDNLGLKLTALFLAVLVYLHVFTDRLATMVVTFPIHYQGLADSLSIAGRAPAEVSAELRGTGKQFIRLYLMEPRLSISLEGTRAGRFRRRIDAKDLPLPRDARLEVVRLVSGDSLEFQIERTITRSVPVSVRVEGTPRAGFAASGEVAIEPARVELRGPMRAVQAIDTLSFGPAWISGGRDTLRVFAAPESLPAWCSIEPEQVQVTVPLVRVTN